MNSINSVEVENLTIAFPQQNSFLKLVDTLNFSILPGETVALLGESGCGKSMTALAMMRLLPHNAGYGQFSKINLQGQDLLNLPEQVMRGLRGKRIAIIFQEPMTALNPVLTIGDQLREAVSSVSTKWTKATLHQYLVKLLQEVEITEPALRLNQYPHQLSGGQKQRVVIAMALANNPEILIADEPTTALDVTIQAQILYLLKKLQQQHKMSLLLITHDLSVVKTIADRVLVMYAGELVETAFVPDFFKRVKHPYSQQLMAAIPSYARRSYRLPNRGGVPLTSEKTQGCLFQSRCDYALAICSRQHPALLSFENRSVRCFLYPEQSALPVLTSDDAVWPARSLSDNVLLEVKNLSVQFALRRSILQRKTSQLVAVDDLSLRVLEGETLAVVGESGSGKTTVARAILGLHTIQAGKIIFAGQEIHHLHYKQLKNYRKQVQLIFQDPFSSLNPRMTVAEIISEGMIAQGLSPRLQKQRQLQLLDQVNLPQNVLDRYPHQFSGGQRQRIGIARALATNPRLLVCDEPTSALDVSVQAQIINLLKELQYELNISYLFITHNMAVVSYLADEILVMRHGKKIEFGSTKQILENPQQDYTKKLLASIWEVK